MGWPTTPPDVASTTSLLLGRPSKTKNKARDKINACRVFRDRILLFNGEKKFSQTDRRIANVVGLNLGPNYFDFPIKEIVRSKS